MPRADAREGLIVVRVRHRIHAQDVDDLRQFAAELFELDRLRRSARRPQTARSFTAKRDAGTCFPGFGGGRTDSVDRLDNPTVAGATSASNERQVPRSMAPSMSTPCARNAR